MEKTWLVAGLGNPGIKYEKTRHNIGFMIVDQLHASAGMVTWQEKFSAHVAKTRYEGNSLVLLKPQTYMNLSGRSLARAAHFWQIPPAQTIVIHDELDLPFGHLRIKNGGGHGGHNGIASCAQELGTADFVRVRVGIDRPRFGTATQWVLEKFSTDEEIELDGVIADASDATVSIIRLGIIRAMNQFNQKKGEPK
ncbi:MAG: aminoacyl-tRNA hydrolase [Myxococcales bacterium]|nr:aminoacyl-tRNA hydrolase [Myxococcales bacterium]